MSHQYVDECGYPISSTEVLRRMRMKAPIIRGNWHGKDDTPANDNEDDKVKSQNDKEK